MQWISKKALLKGLNCSREFWLSIQNFPVIIEKNEETYDPFQVTKKTAFQLFTGGILVEGKDLKERASQTIELLKKKEDIILFEPVFFYENIILIIDILVKNKNSFFLYEVKSSTSIKKEYSYDLAIQDFILSCLGYQPNQLFLVHIQGNYVKKGEIDIHKLFVIEELTELAREKIQEIRKRIPELLTISLKNEIPEKKIEEYCFISDCEYKKECLEIKENSIMKLNRLDKKTKWNLFENKIVFFEDLPKEYLETLEKRQKIQVLSYLEDKEYKELNELKNFLSTLNYPLYFIDFETFQTPIPLYDNTYPYEHIPFQFSLHWKDTREGEIFHFEFLADEKEDPREKFIQQLVSHIPKNVCILAYNANFEKSIIKKLAQKFPHHHEQLMAIQKNIKDLMLPFKNFYYYNKKMQGSYSIKSVLPALVSGLGYKDLEIQDGAQATQWYKNLFLIQEKEKREKIRKKLLEYCALDTYAMVQIVEKLYHIVEEK